MLKEEYMLKDLLIFDNSSKIPKSVKSKKKTQAKQSKKRHACYTYKKDARYIQRAKSAYGLAAEDEYKQFSKAKDRAFASCCPDEDFSSRRSSGWKDNPGNKYMHQWEPKAIREFEKIKKRKTRE